MNIQDQIEQAKKLIEQKEFDKALVILQESLQNSGDLFVTSIKFEIGKIYYIKQDYEKAKKEFLQIKDDENYSCLVYDFLIKIYYVQKKYEEIIKVSGVLKQIGSLDLIKYLIYSFINIGKYEEALNIIESFKDKNIRNNLKEEINNIYRNIINELYGRQKYRECLNLIESLKDKDIRNNLKEEINNVYIYIINELFNQKQYKECFYVLRILNEKDKYYKILKDIINYVIKLNYDNEKEEIKKIYDDIYSQIPDIFKKEKNILLNEYEISQGKTELKSYPIDFQITLTRKCNLRCIMCGVPYENLNYSLSDKEIDEIIELMPYLNNLTLQGGEVFFDKRITKILEAAKENNTCAKIITNGILLNRSIIETLVSINVNLIISIDSCNKQNYEQIRVGAKFEQLIDNINLLNKVREEKKSNIHLTLAMVVMKRNYNEIEDIISFANKYKFSAVTLSQIYGNLPKDNQNFFDFDVDYNIIKELDNKREIFYSLAEKYSIDLQNKLPRLSDYDCKNIINNNTENINGTISQQANIDDKKEECDLKIQDVSFKKEKNNIDSKCKIVENFNKHPLFCYKPFKNFFIDDCNFYPHCICAHTDNQINEFRNGDFKNLKGNSILKRWNSKYMQNYRAKMFEKKQQDICTSRCLRTKEINSI